jgi:hypothetical protein
MEDNESPKPTVQKYNPFLNAQRIAFVCLKCKYITYSAFNEISKKIAEEKMENHFCL